MKGVFTWKSWQVFIGVMILHNNIKHIQSEYVMVLEGSQSLSLKNVSMPEEISEGANTFIHRKLRNVMSV